MTSQVYQMANNPLLHLQPELIWKHFQTLCNTPRPTFHETCVLDMLKEWAKQQNLECEQDSFGNLLIKKPASVGCEDYPTVILQGHVDMVSQKNANSDHDFTTEPLAIYIEDGWVKAKDTTLGADNGIGVAAALAVLESRDIAHGPLEVLLTTEEETGMGGANALQPHWLSGQYLLNLDSEDQGDIYIGCAGGVDVNLSDQPARTPLSEDEISLNLTLGGLQGGHSGLDIHTDKSSACVLLAQCLAHINRRVAIRLASLSAGSLRNAIARDAHATIVFKQPMAEQVEAAIQAFEQHIRPNLGRGDSGFTLTAERANVSDAVADEDSSRIIYLLNALPHGVNRVDIQDTLVVDTSNNLGTIHLNNDGLMVCLLVRSLCDVRTLALADQITSIATLAKVKVQTDQFYPGWQPQANSHLLTLFQETHQQLVGENANVKVIHAGLECGIIGSKYPDVEMISFGPNIRGAHSPKERLEISSVSEFWRLLCALLTKINA